MIQMIIEQEYKRLEDAYNAEREAARGLLEIIKMNGMLLDKYIRINDELRAEIQKAREQTDLDDLE